MKADIPVSQEQPDTKPAEISIKKQEAQVDQNKNSKNAENDGKGIVDKDKFLFEENDLLRDLEKKAKNESLSFTEGLTFESGAVYKGK